MKNNHLITGILLTTLVSACSAGNTPTIKPPEKPQPAANCPIIDSTDWVSWLNKMPGPDGASLHVSGRITLPTPGYTVAVKMGPLDRRQPPAQRLTLEVTPPTGIVAQVITTQEVKAKLPALASSYRAVIIGCGGKALAEITKVETVY